MQVRVAVREKVRLELTTFNLKRFNFVHATNEFAMTVVTRCADLDANQQVKNTAYSLRAIAYANPEEISMTTLASDYQMMLSTWQQHTQAEFALKDADAALATMTANPHVLFVPTGTGGTGREAVHDFYANHFLPSIPRDFGLASVSQIFAQDHIVEEFVVSFTHTLKMDWMLPGVPVTGRKTEFPLVGVIRFEQGKVAGEHLYWDQATVLSQLGILNGPVATAGAGAAVKLLKRSTQRG
jgi:carboxymethylenebutenolidase